LFPFNPETRTEEGVVVVVGYHSTDNALYCNWEENEGHRNEASKGHV
jgi:hypothetical protein